MSNKVNDIMRLARYRRQRHYRKQDLEKREGGFHILANEFNVHNYGRNMNVVPRSTMNTNGGTEN